MKEDKIAKQLASILPDRQTSSGVDYANTPKLIEQEASNIKAKQAAKELAHIKFKEKQRLKSMEMQQQKKQSLAKELGISEDDIPDGQTEIQTRRIAEQQKKLEVIEAIEEETVNPLDARELANKGTSLSPHFVHKAIQLQGTTRPEITRLLSSLNINLSVQLTKQDTANLLACLLTCNEAQMQALYTNKKIPLAIKAIIKRLLDDARLGNIAIVEKLWDRIFGKGQMQLDLPEQQQLQTGIIPNVPISREAYIVIRDTLIK